MKLPARLLVGVALAARVAAAEPPRSGEVIIVGESSDHLVRDLKAQLEESRIRARVLAPSGAPLQTVAAAEQARAVVRVPAAHEELQVWLASWQAGRPLLETRLRNADGDEDALVQQCIELLRENAPTVTEPPRAAPATTPFAALGVAHPEAKRPTLSLRLELAAAYQIAGSRVRWPSLDGAVGLRSQRWFALAYGSAPWSSAVVRESEGDAHVQSSSFGVVAGASWQTGRVLLRVGPALGARSLSVIGTDSAARVRAQHAWQLEAGLQAQLEYRGPISFFGGLRAGALAPSAHLRFFDAQRASFGPLVFGAQLGVAFDALD